VQNKGEVASERKRLQADIDKVMEKRRILNKDGSGVRYRVEINPSFASVSTQMYGGGTP